MSRDFEYEKRIAELTGRGIQQAPIDCSACQGRGKSPWEQPCTGCGGEGQILEYVFADAICDHEVAMCDCKQAWQDGPRGFVFLNDPESVEFTGKSREVARLEKILRSTDHLMTVEEARAA